MGDKHSQFPKTSAATSVLGRKSRIFIVNCLGNYDGKQRLAISAGLPAAPSGSHAARRETREHPELRVGPPRVLATWVGYLGARAGPGAGYLGWLLGCPCGAWCGLFALATWVPVRGLVLAT